MRYFGILCAVKAHAIATTFTFGGNPVVSSKGTSYFNDMLGTTLGAKAKGKKHSAAALTAFGEGADADKTFFTGKPYVEDLGHAFLFRNYRASLAKWQTADPLGYPDGWNRLGYCGNGVIGAVDLLGCATEVYEIMNCKSFEDPWNSFGSTFVHNLYCYH